MAGYHCPMPIGIVSLHSVHHQCYSFLQCPSVVGHYECLTSYCWIAHSEKRGFVKEYSNFDPQKQGVLVTKGSFGRKNAII